MTWHLFNSDYPASPSKAKVGDVFILAKEAAGSEGPGCRGKEIRIPVGTYIIVSRKSFRGGTQEIEAVK